MAVPEADLTKHYADEVWTGVEYQVAAHLIYQGLVEEGLAIVKAISGRYDGARRNPWNQIEWGNHYSRAMANYSVFLALSGFRYSAVEQSVTFHPRLNPDNFSCFFAAASAWGRHMQNRRGGILKATLGSRHGNITLRQMVLGSDSKYGAAITATMTAPNGNSVLCNARVHTDTVQVDLSEKLVIREGEEVTLTVSA